MCRQVGPSLALTLFLLTSLPFEAGLVVGAPDPDLCGARSQSFDCRAHRRTPDPDEGVRLTEVAPRVSLEPLWADW